MKSKTKTIFLLLLNMVALSSCRSNKNDDYSLYYSYSGKGKGVEVYCWEKYNTWYLGLLPGTTRLKSPEEVQWLQDNLPCPIYKMREILDTILEQSEKRYTFVCIVSTPPKVEELNHEPNDSEALQWLCRQLGLLSDDTKLSRNKNYKNNYKIEFMQTAYRVRFYSKYNGVSLSDSNKERICV